MTRRNEAIKGFCTHCVLAEVTWKVPYYHPYGYMEGSKLRKWSTKQCAEIFMENGLQPYSDRRLEPMERIHNSLELRL